MCKHRQLNRLVFFVISFSWLLLFDGYFIGSGYQAKVAVNQLICSDFLFLEKLATVSLVNLGLLGILRVEIIERFIRLFGKDCIDCLVADREFVGEHWTGYLNASGIRYYLRIRQNFWLQKPCNGKCIKASWLFNGLKLGEQKFLHKLYLLKGECVYHHIHPIE